MGGLSAIQRARKTVIGIAAIAISGLVQAVASPSLAHADATETGGDYIAVTQAKVFDSRGTTGPLASGASVNVPVLGQVGVPSSGVGAVVVDVTAVSPTGDGYIRLAPADGSTPDTSSLSYNDGQNASNSTVVAPGSTGQLTLTNHLATTGVVVSVEGYFTTAGSSGPAPGGFVPIDGTRVLDTRNGTGVSVAAPLSANHMATVAVAGQGAVPADAAAAVVNITGLNATASGYLTAWASEASKPATGAVNYSDAGAISTLVTVPIGADGNIAVQVSNGTADVVIDVQGYFSANAADGVGLTLANDRLFDTRVSPNTAIPANSTIGVDITTSDMVALASAIVVNVTAISPQATGTLRLWTAGADEPSTSQINFESGDGHSNLQILQPNNDGQISIHNLSAGTVDVVLDLEGWFASDDTPVSDDGSIGTPPARTGSGPQYEEGSAGTGNLSDASGVMPTGSEDDDLGTDGSEGATPSAVIGSDDRTRINPTTSFPWKTVVQIAFTNPKGTRQLCSGALIGVDTVATAGHCVYSTGANGEGWNTNVRVYPARNGSSYPYGKCGSSRLSSVTGWTHKHNAQYDYGAVKLSCTVGMATGWSGYAKEPSYPAGKSIRITGYPGEKNPRYSMWTDTGTIDHADNLGLQYYYTVDTTSGQSGAPIMQSQNELCSRCVIGVHTYGPYGGEQGLNRGNAFTQAAFNNYKSWVAASR